ncbi:MAG: hypothetical protein H7Y17_12315 [Chlorobia bacterium]|nr:hypothetical protein [Fimbriimonadaceae bacterium]
MTNLVLALCALACLSHPSPGADLPHFRSIAAGIADFPLKAPSGWKSENADGATVITPGDVPTGKLYVVMATPTSGKAGSLDEILETGKKVIADIGVFKPATEPKPEKSDGGWEYQFVLGSLVKGDRNLVAEVLAIKKGDEGWVALVLSDSVETMEKYADDFTKMLRGMGGSKPPPITGGSGKADLQYTLPPEWTESKINGLPLLVKEKNEEYNKYRVSLLVFPSEPISGSTREQFVGYWRAFIAPNYTTTIAPIPLMVRLKNGYACAFDGEWDAKDKNGAPITIALYMVAHGGRVVPIMGMFTGPNWFSDGKVDVEVGKILETSRIPGASAIRVKLFNATNLAGDWTESGTEHAKYVYRDGSYAGNATSATATYFTIGSDGTYNRTLLAVGAGGNIREKDAGTWTVDDDEIVLSKGGRITLHGYGDDPKIGRFLVIGNYANTRSYLKFTNPRGILQAKWLKAKK